MNERVEEIRRQHAEHVAEYPRPHFCEDYGCQTVGVLLTALAQAERERERLENDLSLLRGQIELRGRAVMEARAEVERLRAQHRKEISEIVSQAQDVTEAAEARTRALEAALETAANRLDIAASVIRSGGEFARWAAEARAVPLWRAGDE